MTKQVLILNITRMGDLVQMTPLLRRLEHEWPRVAIDLVIDTEFSEMASLLPGIRQVLAYDFQTLMDESRVCRRNVVRLYEDVREWAESLAGMGYDRVINLTFNARSAYLTGFLGVEDTRGLTTASDGSIIVKNPWMKYFLDMHRHRRINRFNLVDVYALGGSGPGPHEPIRLRCDPEHQQWGRRFLAEAGGPSRWIAVQVGASDVMKAWRPALFGDTMARLGQQCDAGFVLIGSKKEQPAVQQAAEAYRNAGGQAPLCHAVGKTTLSHLVGLLSCCDLMLTNDTGPMHLAVGVGTPVVNLSVGHVDFRETGPYGPGHWVVQPDIECGPCGFDQVCSHHTCKDRVSVETVTALCLHALGTAPFPSVPPGMRIYASSVDGDGLGAFELRGGREDALRRWYGAFWRKFWFHDHTHVDSAECGESDAPPDAQRVAEIYEQLMPMLDRLCELAQRVAALTMQVPLPAAQLQAAQEALRTHSHEARALGYSTHAFSPVTAACYRETYNLSQPDLQGMARESVNAYERWRMRTRDIGRHMLGEHLAAERGGAYAGTT